MVHPLLLRVSKLNPLTPADEQALLDCVVRERTVDRHEDIVAQGSSPSESSVIIEGMAGRYKVLDEGQRQITALHILGDFVDLHSFPLTAMDHAVVALTPCRIGVVPHAKIRHISDTLPHLTRLLWLLTVIDAAIHREWLVAIGRRTSLQRISHLLCELHLRFKQVNLAPGKSFVLPLTQTELADTVGLSLVHVNRTLGELRELDLVTWRNHEVTIHDFDRLADLAEFDPTYLNLVGKPL